MINKQLLLEDIIQTLEDVLQTAKDSALRAHETATNKESIAENKYDTFGLEASYLAQGQLKRVAECEADLEAYQTFSIENNQQIISLGSLVNLIDEKEQNQWLFLGPNAGGLKVRSKSADSIEFNITIVTPSAPLGKQLLGCSVDDEFEFQAGHKNKFYYVGQVI